MICNVKYITFIALNYRTYTYLRQKLIIDKDKNEPIN